jgi:hypothetical protein
LFEKTESGPTTISNRDQKKCGREERSERREKEREGGRGEERRERGRGKKGGIIREGRRTRTRTILIDFCFSSVPQSCAHWFPLK